MSPSASGLNPDIDIPNLKGKVVIVTGGNEGIGYATIQHLAAHGAKVYMAARSEEKAREAISRLHSDAPAPRCGEVIWLPLDLIDPVLAQKAAREFLTREPRLDVLINNAAMPRGPYVKTCHGIQDAMMTNHVSPFVFTLTLLLLLAKTAEDPRNDVRIVNLSSGGIAYLRRGLRFRDIDDFNDDHAWDIIPGPSLARYCRSKLANVLFATELQRRLDSIDVPIVVTAVDPGLVRTAGVESDAASQPPIVSHIMSVLVRTFWTPPTRGAFASVFAAVAPAVRAQVERYKGAWLQPPGGLGTPPNADARSSDLAEELWRTTERLLGEIGLHLPAVRVSDSYTEVADGGTV